MTQPLDRRLATEALVAAELADKVDTTDPRLSDARPPTSHAHPATQITGLATVATTGAYGDLTGAPAIPNSPDDVGAQPAGSYATNAELADGLAGKQDTATLAADTAAHVADGSALDVALRAASGTYTGERTWTARQTFDGDVRLTRGTEDWLIRGSGTTVEFRLDGASDWLGRIQNNGDFQVRGGLIGAGFTNFGKAGRRIPFDNSVTIDGSLLTAANLQDKVAMTNSVVFKGGFSNEATYGLANPGFVWGANDYVLTGTAAGDVAGITDIQGRLTEAHLRTPGATINNIAAFIAESYVESAATGATVTGLLASIIARAPANTVGASVANAASLRVESPAAGTATVQHALYVAGTEKSYFGGDILMNTDTGSPRTLNAFAGTVRGMTFTVGPTTLTSAARLTVKSNVDGDVVAAFQGRGGQTADIATFGQDATVHSRIDKRGRLVMRQTSAPADADLANGDLAFYVDSTSGAMKLMIKAKDVGGTVRTAQVALA